MPLLTFDDLPGVVTPGRVADLNPPDLDNFLEFVPRKDVPVLDAHEHGEKGDVDVPLLRLLAANTNARCDRGDLVAITIGHTNHDGPEDLQPPFVGWARNFSVGTFRDEPCLLADFYFNADDAARALQFPHRSIERIRSENPADNYIDYVSLLRRPPERSLGLLTYARTLPAGADVVRYSRDFTPDAPPVAADAGPSPEPAPPAQPPEETMDEETIKTLAAAISGPILEALAPLLAAKPEDADRVKMGEGDEAPEKKDGEEGEEDPDRVQNCEGDDKKDDDSDKDRVQMEEASPGGDSTFVPGLVKKDDEDEGDRVQMSRALKAKDVEIQKLQDQVDGLAVKFARLQYAREFDTLATEGVVFDRDREMKEILELPAKLRDGHIVRMREQYRRNPVGRKDEVATADLTPPADPAAPTADPAERAAVLDYATKHGITDIPTARLKYRQEKDSRVRS